MKTNRPCKRLDARYSKFTIKEIIGSHSFRLDTPPGIHDFHARLSRPANDSPLIGQLVDDNQPLPIMINGSEEYEIDWELESLLVDTIALETWKNKPINRLATKQ